MMKNGKIKSIERIEKKDGTVDFKLGIDDKLYVLHNVEISQGNLEHNEDDSHSLSINFTFDYLGDKIFQKMNEDYVSFETAKLLKEKGFNWYTYAYYEDENDSNIILHASKAINWNKTEFISKPTLQMAMKWLREEHKIIIVIQKEIYTGSGNWWYRIDRSDRPYIDSTESDANYESHELAAEVAIKYCLENLI